MANPQARRTTPAAPGSSPDIATLDLPAHGITEPFDVIVSAGNVITFVAADDRRAALARLAAHLADDGRVVLGFGSGRGYVFDEFRDNCGAVGLCAEVELSTWDLRPFTPDATFLVAVLGRAS